MVCSGLRARLTLGRSRIDRGGEMFDRIESITNAAVWDGYNGRASDVPNFARYNLIYGWNASGKTTLSRVFSLFSPPAVSKLPAGARARIRMGSEVLDSSKEQDQGRVSVCVFNRDFIDSNLKADYTEAPALFIVGKDNIRLSGRIASLARRRERVGRMYRAVKKAQDDATKAREKAATDLARECATMLGVRDFRAPDLKDLARSMPTPTESLLDDAALQETVSQARDQSEFARINSLPVVVSSPPLGEELTRLLSHTPKRSTLKRLADDPALSDWVRSGLRFHEHDATCAFCGGDAARALEEYSKHFSDEYRRQHAAITSALASVEQPKNVPTYPHELQWVPEVRAKVRAAKEQLEAWIAQENETRRKVSEMLRKKLADMEAVMALDLGQGHSSELATIPRSFRKPRKNITVHAKSSMPGVEQQQPRSRTTSPRDTCLIPALLKQLRQSAVPLRSSSMSGVSARRSRPWRCRRTRSFSEAQWPPASSTSCYSDFWARTSAWNRPKTGASSSLGKGIRRPT